MELVAPSRVGNVREIWGDGHDGCGTSASCQGSCRRSRLSCVCVCHVRRYVRQRADRARYSLEPTGAFLMATLSRPAFNLAAAERAVSFASHGRMTSRRHAVVVSPSPNDARLPFAISVISNRDGWPRLTPSPSGLFRGHFALGSFTSPDAEAAQAIRDN